MCEANRCKAYAHTVSGWVMTHKPRVRDHNPTHHHIECEWSLDLIRKIFALVTYLKPYRLFMLHLSKSNLIKIYTELKGIFTFLVDLD